MSIDKTFLPLDEAVTRAVFVIVSGSDGRTGGNPFELIGTHGRAIEWAYPRPLASPYNIVPKLEVEKSPFKIAAIDWRSTKMSIEHVW